MKAKLLSIWNFIKNDAKDTWNRSKMFLLAILGLVIYFEFDKIKQALLVYGAKKETDTSHKEDQVLATKEKSENDQANALIKTAEDLPKQEGQVSDDWNTK